MSEREHIGIYCGLLPDAIPALHEARQRWPEARITAIVPPAFAQTEEAKHLVDDFMVTARNAYSPLHPLAIVQFAKALRARHFDRFVTLFITLQQEVLAVISGARRAEIWRGESRIHPLATTWAGLVGGTLKRHIKGRLRYLWLTLYVVFARVPRPR